MSVRPSMQARTTRTLMQFAYYTCTYTHTLNLACMSVPTHSRPGETAALNWKEIIANMEKCHNGQN